MTASFVTSLYIDWEEVAPDSYYRNIPALRSFDELHFDSNITLFCGENGTGKSTLIEAIAIAFGFNPEGGTRNFAFSTYRDTSDLSAATHLFRGMNRAGSGYFFRAESFFNVATKAKEYWGDEKSPYGDIHTQSHGEGFLSFFQAFERAGLYIMDEPEAALSPQRQLTLLAQIYDMAQTGSQFIIATHSPILLGTPNACIYSFDDEKISRIDYEDTSSYQITELFINNRDRLLRQLLS
ncbi:MAG: AAA family ATPase [Coriobacteriales bacterium]|nr:AAA family ATPase [Coriobacteriales bacterium]